MKHIRKDGTILWTDRGIMNLCRKDAPFIIVPWGTTVSNDRKIALARPQSRRPDWAGMDEEIEHAIREIARELVRELSERRIERDRQAIRAHS